ncbi:protein FANTASTIC FOUR 3-like [Syzygium oleosum]|uniref:protein FANTASTIC FOUR 3-like n=1 Tax=Syzygium oleosum TaxID=219896 RepID=UPI0024BABC0C|nr:protein FANTASTIC FOUR 3-like [Syzygium oleosum]
MATVVCQGLQSCLESRIVEPVSLRLKLTSPSPPLFSQFLDVPSKSSLLGNSSKGSEVQNETPKMTSNFNKQDFAYVPPLTKSPSWISLRERSLEMCTEDLGNETGIVGHVSESMVLLSVLTDGSRYDRNLPKPREHAGAKEPTRRGFPPPLTTIRGVKSLQVRPHREDGRLVIEAIETPPCYPHFRAERSDGWLQLCFLGEPTSSCGDSVDDEEECSTTTRWKTMKRSGKKAVSSRKKKQMVMKMMREMMPLVMSRASLRDVEDARKEGLKIEGC